MIYDKMPIVLLSKMASLPDDYTNNRIALYLLTRHDKVNSLTISSLADDCHVSVSSISRFCREIGLSDFHELKEILRDSRFRFESASQKLSPGERANDLIGKVESSMEEGMNSLDFDIISELVRDMKTYEKVSAFGLLKAESAAINLQVDLLMQKKMINTKLAYDEQKKHLATADEGDLVIIFSYTASYFSEGLGLDLINRANRPRIYLISGARTLPDNPMVYRNIQFSSKQNQLCHPYQLLLISSIISQEYCHSNIS